MQELRAHRSWRFTVWVYVLVLIDPGPWVYILALDFIKSVTLNTLYDLSMLQVFFSLFVTRITILMNKLNYKYFIKSVAFKRMLYM